MRKLFFLIVILFVQVSCLDEKQQAEKILRHYINQKVDPIRRYTMESEVALWNATVSGNETDYQKMVDIELDFNKSNQNTSNRFAPDRFSTITQNVFTNEQDFQLLRKLKYSGLITDSLLVRQLNVLYQTFMGSQIDSEKYKKLMMTEVKLWQTFSTMKIAVGGKKYSASQVDSIRKNTTDGALLKEVFEAYHQQGRLFAPDIIRMVKERNEYAVNFGYPDFYHLSLESNDQTPERIKLLLDEIELKTRDQFHEAKSVVDKMLAKRFRIPEKELNPWHYNDERASYLPPQFAAQLDSIFSNIDPIKKTSQFFDEIGLPIQKVIDNSDLEYRPEKASINSMINVDFKNDIRLISAIQHTHDGMLRMMHLGGHASHYNSISDDIPYLLKTPIPAIYEGIARYFEYLASDSKWLKDEIHLDENQQKQVILICRHLHQVDRLFRCRKLIVMANFEEEIYRNPDQNLDSLWQNLNLKYLGLDYPVEKSTGFWAANKYSVSLSCTTHNFVLADVFAAQLQHTIETKVLKETSGFYNNNKAIGNYLVDNLYKYGNLLPWEKLIEKATGEPLNSTYFVNQLIVDEYNAKN